MRESADGVTGVGLTLVTLVVRDYDIAIDWFTKCLGFVLLEDTPLGGGKRWVRIAAPGSGAALLLAKAAGDEQATLRIDLVLRSCFLSLLFNSKSS